jgi:2-(1,2-epoxy-1,2-dihydrophenyl)acetyl-CoA isomerase
MSDEVIVTRHDAVAIVTMNRPTKRNALGTELYPLLAKRLAELQDDSTVRALVLTGGEHFCAGGDLADLKLPGLEMRRAMHVGHGIVRALVGGRLPAVAAVQGCAYGAGFSMAIACDFVVADETAVFCAAFGRVGLVPDYGLLWTLPQRLSIAKTREIVMFCEPIRAAEAQQLGLVDRLVEPNNALESATRMAERLAAASPGSLAATKAVLSRLPMNLDTLLAWEADMQTLLLNSADFAEGVQSLQERRAADFKGQ